MACRPRGKGLVNPRVTGYIGSPGKASSSWRRPDGSPPFSSTHSRQCVRKSRRRELSCKLRAFKSANQLGVWRQAARRGFCVVDSRSAKAGGSSVFRRGRRRPTYNGQVRGILRVARRPARRSHKRLAWHGLNVSEGQTDANLVRFLCIVWRMKSLCTTPNFVDRFNPP